MDDHDIDIETREWETPTATEIRMDAEIGSYQADDEPEREAP